MESKEVQKQRNICTKYKPYAKKSTSGITLIALVVTIIVLLILAGISINLILGENGIITKASMAKEAQEKAQLKEEAELVKATGLAENLSKVDGEYRKADLLEDLNNNFEGSTLGSDRITTSDGKYDIIVDDDLNITVEKSGEVESGGIIITSDVVKEDTNTYIELYFEIEGKKNFQEFMIDYLNTNIYPDIDDSTELENIITDEYSITFDDTMRESMTEEAASIGGTYTDYLRYIIFMYEIKKEYPNASGIPLYSEVYYRYYCYYFDEEEYTEETALEQQALRIFNFDCSFDEAAASIGTSKEQLQQEAQNKSYTYAQYLRHKIAQLCEQYYDINVTVSNGDKFSVTLTEGMKSYTVTRAGEYKFTATILGGKEGETTVAVKENEVDAWEVAWTCTDGTTWSDQITNDGTTQLPSEGVIAKLYNTGNTITPQLPEGLGGAFLDEGPEYKLVFEGSGSMASLDGDELKAWHKSQHAYYVTEVIITEGITNIADYAFSAFISLETIDIAETVGDIGASAFTLCYKLTSSITIPEEMTSIGESTFSECSSITQITIPDSITSIEAYAFKNCSSLTNNISIPENVTYIGTEAFYGCSAIKEITIPDGITEISYGAFGYCANLTSVTIPNSVTTINDTAFKCTKLTSIVIPDTVQSIGRDVFSGCSELASIELSSNISSINDYSFANCTKLKTITIPGNVTSIGAWAFMGCTALETIVIPDSVTELGQEVFSDCTSLESATLSNNITIINIKMFYNCSALTSITIPSAVTTIKTSAFENCSSLKSVTNLASNYTIVGDNAFMGLPANSYIYVSNSTIQAKFVDGTNYDSTKTTISIK